MNDTLLKIKRLTRQLAGLFPSAVPVGVQEFEEWASSIINTYPIPADEDSIKFALATMVLHSGPTSAYVPKFKYFLMLRAGMAKQVAGAVFQDIKTKQQERAKLAAETALAASNVQPVQQ